MQNLTATVVTAHDIALSGDDATRRHNEAVLYPIMGPQTKLSGEIEILGAEQHILYISFMSKGGIREQLALATTDKDIFDGGEQLIQSDHVRSSSIGGNAYNVSEHCKLMAEYERTNHRPVVYEHTTRRRILQVPAESASRVLGAAYPSDLAPFQAHRSEIQTGIANISDVNLAALFGENKNTGHVPHIDSTSSALVENGKISAHYGKSPVLSIGMKEMAMFLKGAAHSDEIFHYNGRRIVHADTHDERVPYLENGVLNPSVQQTINRFGWMYSNLLYEGVGRKRSAPCDLVLTAGQQGGAMRMDNTWVYSSVPGPEGERMLIDLLDKDKRLADGPYPTDIDNTKHTPGCGDIVAALHTLYNVEFELERRRIANALPGKVETNEQRIDLASIIYTSVLMRLHSKLMFHTQGTSLAHIGESFFENLQRRIATESLSAVQHVNTLAIHTRRAFHIRIPSLDIDLAIWRQDEDQEWPVSPRPIQLHGIERDVPDDELYYI